MAKIKQYAVEVLQAHQHGRYGKDFYFGMYLPGYSKKDAEFVGLETLADMSFDEIKSRMVNPDRQYPWEIHHQREHEAKNGKGAPIGIVNAATFFCCRAYIEK